MLLICLVKVLNAICAFTSALNSDKLIRDKPSEMCATKAEIHQKCNLGKDFIVGTLCSPGVGVSHPTLGCKHHWCFLGLCLLPASLSPAQTPSPPASPGSHLSLGISFHPPPAWARGKFVFIWRRSLSHPEIYSELNLSNTFSPAQALQKPKQEELAQIFIFHVHSGFSSDFLLEVTKHPTTEKSKSPPCQVGDILQD